MVAEKPMASLLNFQKIKVKAVSCSGLF